jgi:hypothetical protein
MRVNAYAAPAAGEPLGTTLTVPDPPPGHW